MRILCLAAALISAPAYAAPPSIFGLVLGKPVSIPECPRSRLSGGGFSEVVYEQNPPQTCHEPDIALRDAPWRRGAVVFPSRRAPLIMLGNSGYTLIVDGKLEGIDIDTLSHNNTHAILRELTAKFGKPTSVVSEQAVVAGIAVPSLVATWRLPDILVRYTNINDDLEAGALRIETQALQRVREAHEQTLEGARTPL